MSKTFKKHVTRIIAILMALFAVISMISPCLTVNAASEETVTHARVSIAPLNNTNTDSVDIEVVEEDQDGWRVVNQWDYNGGTNAGKFVSRYCGASKSGEPSTEKYDSNKESDTSIENKSGTNGCVYLSFPGQQYKNEHGITSADVALASNVSSIMTDSFEKLMELINKSVNSSTSDDFSISNVTEQMMKLTEGENGSGKGSFTLGNYKVTFTPLTEADSSRYSEAKSTNKYKVTDGYSKGTSATNYSVVSVSKGNSEINYEVIQFSVPKGYASDQYNPKGYDSSNDDAPSPVKYISMKGMAFYAARMENYGHVSGSSSYKLMYGDDDNIITNIIKTMFNSVFNSLYKMLGCEDVVSIIFNRGARSVSYYEGVTPYSYLDVAQIFFWISMVIASFVMFYSIYLVIIKHSLADISPAVRVDVKDSIKSLIYVIIMEIIFVPVFALMCRLNGLIVSMFSSLIGSSVNLTDVGGGSIGVILFSFLTFGMTIALNVRYVVRSIVVAVCYGVAPVAIASVSVDNKHSLFNTWLKELIANIFLQSFNAIILAFLLMITTSSKGIMRFIILYSFMPLNKWFMEDLMGARTGASVASDHAMQGLSNANERLMNSASNAARVAIAAGSNGNAPKLGTPKNTGGLGGGSDNSMKQLKGYTQSTGANNLLTAGEGKKKGSGLINATQNALKSEGFSKLATGAAALGVAGASLAGVKVNPNTAMALGKAAGAGFRRKQNELANGFAGVKSGYAHINENGEVDGVAFSKAEKDAFNQKNGLSGSWQKADVHKIDSNQIGSDSINALKGNQAKYFADDAGLFRPSLQSDDKGNNYVVSSAGTVPNMHQKQGAVQRELNAKTNAASAFGLSGQAFASVATAATKSYGYDIVSNAMAVKMPNGTTKYATTQQQLVSYQEKGGRVAGMVQAGQLSTERFTPNEMSQMVNDDSYKARLGAMDIAKIGDKTMVISNIGDNVPNAASMISTVQSDVKSLADKGYHGSKMKSYSSFNDDGDMQTFYRIESDKNPDGTVSYPVYSKPGKDDTDEVEVELEAAINDDKRMVDKDNMLLDSYPIEAYGRRNVKDGPVVEMMSMDAWNRMSEVEQANAKQDGWELENFKSVPRQVLTPEEYTDYKENPSNYHVSSGKELHLEPITSFELSDNYQEGQNKNEYADIAKEEFNVNNIQSNVRFVSGNDFIKDGIFDNNNYIVMRGDANANPPNVDGIIGNRKKEVAKENGQKRTEKRKAEREKQEIEWGLNPNEEPLDDADFIYPDD